MKKACICLLIIQGSRFSFQWLIERKKTVGADSNPDISNFSRMVLYFTRRHFRRRVGQLEKKNSDPWSQRWRPMKFHLEQNDCAPLYWYFWLFFKSDVNFKIMWLSGAGAFNIMHLHDKHINFQFPMQCRRILISSARSLLWTHQNL